MLSHQRDHLRAHVVTIKRVEVESIQKTFCRRHTCFLMSARTQPAFDKFGRRRLSEVMRERGEHHRNSASHRKSSINSRARSTTRRRVNKNVAFRMPLRILRHIDQRFDLRKQLVEGAQRLQPTQTDRRAPGAQQQFLHLSPNSFGWKIRKINCATQFHRFWMNSNSKRAANCAARKTRKLSSKKFRLTTARKLRRDVFAARERIDDFFG